MDLSEHFFRRESGRIVAALIRIFGVHNIDLAEDVTQDAFCRAVETWRLRGVPANPSAWLMTTAKNRALDMLRHERTQRTFAPEYGRLLESEWTLVPVLEGLFEEEAIKDDSLRVMFSCCDQRLRPEVQVALILNIVCGFSAAEISSAYLTSLSAQEKRISRGKKALASSHALFDVSGKSEFGKRLPSVQRSLYLLFNEGFHGASPEIAVRTELCGEAIRLSLMLIDHPFGSHPTTHALTALMFLHAARLPSRITVDGDLIVLDEQDRSLWDSALILEGARHLELSATGTALSEYHIEAMIALKHVQSASLSTTDWLGIVELYDLLLTFNPSPIVALNRAIAIGQLRGPEVGLAAILAIGDKDRLKGYPFYSAALGEMHFRIGNYDEASALFASAYSAARNPSERRFLNKKIANCCRSMAFVQT